MSRMGRVALVLFTAMWLIASCGQSGRLYLPEEEETDEERQTSIPHGPAA